MVSLMVGEIAMECVICDVPGTLVIIPRTFDWYLCSVSTLEFAAVPHSWIPHVQIAFSMVLYNSILFSNVCGSFSLIISTFCLVWVQNIYAHWIHAFPSLIFCHLLAECLEDSLIFLVRENCGSRDTKVISIWLYILFSWQYLQYLQIVRVLNRCMNECVSLSQNTNDSPWQHCGNYFPKSYQMPQSDLEKE